MSKIFLAICFLLFALSMVLTASLLGQNSTAEQETRYLGLGFSNRLFPEVDLQDAQLAMKLWMTELLRTTDLQYDPRTLLFPNNSAIVKAIKANKIMVITLSAFDYVQLREQVELEPALLPLSNGIVEQEYIILVRKDRGITSLVQLQGSTLNIQCGGKDFISGIWLDVLLNKNGCANKQTFFSSVKTVSKDSQAILPVFFGNVDCCVASKSAFEIMSKLNPQVKKELTILCLSPSFLRTIFCFVRNYPIKRQTEIETSACTLDANPIGQQILKLFKIEKLIPFENRYLKNIEQLYTDFSQLHEEITKA